MHKLISLALCTRTFHYVTPIFIMVSKGEEGAFIFLWIPHWFKALADQRVWYSSPLTAMRWTLESVLYNVVSGVFLLESVLYNVVSGAFGLEWYNLRAPYLQAGVSVLERYLRCLRVGVSVIGSRARSHNVPLRQHKIYQFLICYKGAAPWHD